MYEQLYHWMKVHLFWIMGGEPFSVKEIVSKKCFSVQLKSRCSKDDVEVFLKEVIVTRKLSYMFEIYEDSPEGWKKETDYLLKQVPVITRLAMWLSVPQATPRTLWELHDLFMQA